MKSKEMKVGSSEWVAAWGKLLGNGIAIRSQIRINPSATAFVGEILFMTRNSPDAKICSVGLWRKIGRANYEDPLSYNPITEFNEFEPPLDTFMGNLCERWWSDRGGKIGNRFAQPVTHVGVVTELVAATPRIIPPSNESLMLRYGMIYEWATTSMEHAFQAADTDRLATMRILQHRLRAFLFEQEMLSANAELGEAVI